MKKRRDKQLCVVALYSNSSLAYYYQRVIYWSGDSVSVLLVLSPRFWLGRLVWRFGSAGFQFFGWKQEEKWAQMKKRIDQQLGGIMTSIPPPPCIGLTCGVLIFWWWSEVSLLSSRSGFGCFLFSAVFRSKLLGWWRRDQPLIGGMAWIYCIYPSSTCEYNCTDQMI